MTKVRLDTRVRWELTQQILLSLRGAFADCRADLRGSLACGTADPYSDIDVLWEVPDSDFQRAIERLPELLSQVQPIESIRTDPDFQKSDRRRLFFVSFEGVPLFWRADIDVLTHSLQGDLTYDLHNEAARGDEWSRAHSALMNAVAAIKALLRGNSTTAGDLVRRGLARVGVDVPSDYGDINTLIVTLVRTVRTQDPRLSRLADRVIALYRDAFC